MDVFSNGNNMSMNDMSDMDVDVDVDANTAKSEQIPTNKVLALQTANNFIAQMDRLNTVDKTYVFKMVKIHFSNIGIALKFLR